jgi:predicted RND superfamily exporter protein
LIGLSSKHGILMVDFANKLQEQQGYGRREAIEHAAAIRLRPILMTTAAMVVAMVPLLIARGAGAASRFDIGVVIAAGMTIGTLFTLFVTPAVYTYLARDHQTAKAREREGEAMVAAVHPGTADTMRETLVEEDAEAEAGLLFSGAPEPEVARPAAAAPGGGRRLMRRERRRKPLAPAAE